MLRRILAVVSLFALGACQSFRTVVVLPDGTRFEVVDTVPGWTEMTATDVSLATGVDGTGNWYLITGDSLSGLTQNPAVATAIVQGVVQGLAEAAKSGLFSP